jgi:hypothetical protein
MNHRQGSGSVIDLSFLLDAPAGKDGFIRVQGSHLVKQNGKPFRFWGFNMTDWSPGSMMIPPKEDAPVYAATLARFGVNFVRLHFLDLAAPRGLIDGKRNDSQRFDAAQLDNEDFFIAEMVKRGIYVDLNLYVGRRFKEEDKVIPSARFPKGALLFDKRLIELEKDYARQLLTHYNPHLKKKYVDEPGVALVELVNETSIYPGWSSNSPYDQELTDLYNAWLQRNLSREKIGKLCEVAGAAGDQPVPRLSAAELPNAPKDRYYTESAFIADTQGGYFKEMGAYLRGTLGVKCPILGASDHGDSRDVSCYPLVASISLLDIVDGHDYWQHPSSEKDPKAVPMVNYPLKSTVVEMARSAVAGKPFTVSEINHPYPNQYASEGIPILAAYAGFLDWAGIGWYAFEQKRDPNHQPYVGDAFDVSLDPVKMPQIAAGALMFLRGDLAPARHTVERSYTREQVWDSRLLPPSERPLFTPGFPASIPLQHGLRIRSLDGAPTAKYTADEADPYRSDTGELAWYHGSGQTGLVTIDSARSQGLIGFVRANRKSVRNLAADVKNDFCSIVLSSLDSRPISNSARLLLTAAVRVENTGMKWNERRTHLTVQGGSPTLIEPVTGKIILRNLNGATGVSARALDGSGRPIGEPIVAAKSGATWEIPVGEPVTTWYEVSVKR